MKKSIGKAWPYLILVNNCFSSCYFRGYLSISMMNVIDIAVSGNKALFKKESINYYC